MDKKLLSEANKAYRKKKYKKALDKYLAFSQHYPDDIKAQERIAICYYEIGQLESAQQICELVINAKTETIEFYRILSLIFEKQGKPEDAEKILRSSIETFPNSASLHNTLGTIFMNQKKLDESIECYQNAIELDNNFWQAYFNLASVFRAKQQYANSLSMRLKAFKIAPSFQTGYWTLVSYEAVHPKYFGATNISLTLTLLLFRSIYLIPVALLFIVAIAYRASLWFQLKSTTKGIGTIIIGILVLTWHLLGVFFK